MSKKQFESKFIRSLQDELKTARKNHANLSNEITKHHSSTVMWEELMKQYSAEADKINKLKKKLKLYVQTGKENGLADGSKGLPSNIRL